MHLLCFILSNFSLVAQIALHFEVIGDARVFGEAYVSEKLGIGTLAPSSLFHIRQSASNWQNGLTLESPGGDRWTTYVDGASQYNFAKNNSIKAWIRDDGEYRVSDKILKTDLQDLESVLRKVNKLRPVRFRFTTGRKDTANKPSIGFIAQEVEVQFPTLVGQSEGILGLDYGKLGVLAIKAIQELSTELSELRETIELKEKKIKTLEIMLRNQQDQIEEHQLLVDKLLSQ